MPRSIPVYSIETFRHFSAENDFYAERLSSHLKKHHFTKHPHKHDFYLVVLFIKGSGVHEIDFQRYPVSPGTLFLMRPGQTHTWNLSEDADGFIFFHTREFYDSVFVHERLHDYPFFSSVHQSPMFKSKIRQPELLFMFNELVKESVASHRYKSLKALSLVNLLYIEFSRIYGTPIAIKNEGYFLKMREFEDLVDKHYRELKLPVEYASRMNITERHLNRIIKICLNKTPSGLIQEKIVLEAKRLLAHSKYSVTEVAERLGYIDNSYFSRLFKKRAGQSPREFMTGYKTIVF